MALFDVKLFSTTLLTNTDIRVIIPTPDEPFLPDDTPYYEKGRKYQVLYLLHGAFGDATVWNRNTGIERYAQEHKLAVVCPSVTNSCYLDMAHGPAFMTYMTVELPRFIQAMFPVSGKQEDNFIAGISMGGYGALRLALEQPGRYACAASLSGGVRLQTGIPDAQTQGGPIQGPFVREDIFGDEPFEGGPNDLLANFRQKLEASVRLPEIYLCCGTEDFIYQDNVWFRDQLTQMGIQFTYEEGPGMHNWDYWDVQIRRVLEWMPLKNRLLED